MLPDIKYTLPVALVLWCLAAWYVFEGPVMLAYPAIWLAVGVCFWGLDRVLSGSRAMSDATAAFQRTAEASSNAKRSDRVGAA